jgi:hypothetical protein
MSAFLRSMHGFLSSADGALLRQHLAAPAAAASGLDGVCVDCASARTALAGQDGLRAAQWRERLRRALEVLGFGRDGAGRGELLQLLSAEWFWSDLLDESTVAALGACGPPSPLTWGACDLTRPVPAHSERPLCDADRQARRPRGLLARRQRRVQPQRLGA